MVLFFMGPLQVNNVSNDQSAFQTNVWLDGIDVNGNQCNDRLVRHWMLWPGQSSPGISLTALSPWLLFISASR